MGLGELNLVVRTAVKYDQDGWNDGTDIYSRLCLDGVGLPCVLVPHDWPALFPLLESPCC